MEIPGKWSIEKLFQPPIPRHYTGKQTQTNSSSVISVLDMGIIDEEWERLQKALEWPSVVQIN